MVPPDPLDQLAHDHGQLSVLVFEILHALEGEQTPPPPVEQGWLRDHLVELREALLLHFAREEEGLFPFLAQHFPEAAPRVEAMSLAHDGICGSVTRMAYLAEQRSESLAAIAPTFRRFLEGYMSHSRLESELVQDFAGRLDAEQRAVLADLIREV
jgi:Hemerythrin HHE cation binding domain